ncbi:hypothetical protein QBC33DRAFT_516409 [Phialemonium atrogriseum]|uniref:Peptidase S8/S53 domain-containing protein n=1 Tax=Phialemonium atrogriseum TaxID=1093897 RepID=A0AAJ0BZM6_9PEZI|nr:uncharacterized protein QBC33DRAFT_516409 [Phialemonium atrogriseum]KAK1765997.1 hypothetical protein QBC33DRAFT_516409 [Phialemonium atrogriseum]
MAHCIREVCPMARLYIARLDDSRLVENQKFTIASCHQGKFVNLIKCAVNSREITIFGSLPDKSVTVETDQFAPVGIDEVIKIGAATIYGENSRKNLHARLDFLLPGENLLSSSGEIVRGSSYATAYASGLAAIVLGRDEVAKTWKKTKTEDGMKVIFRRLSKRNPEDQSERGVFVRPYLTFGQEFDYSQDGKGRLWIAVARHC